MKCNLLACLSSRSFCCRLRHDGEFQTRTWSTSATTPSRRSRLTCSPRRTSLAACPLARRRRGSRSQARSRCAGTPACKAAKCVMYFAADVLHGPCLKAGHRLTDEAASRTLVRQSYYNYKSVKHHSRHVRATGADGSGLDSAPSMIARKLSMRGPEATAMQSSMGRRLTDLLAGAPPAVLSAPLADHMTLFWRVL